MNDSFSTSGIVLVALFALVFLVLVFKLIKLRVDLFKAKFSSEDLRFDSIKTLYQKLNKGLTPSDKTIKRYARDLETRALTFEVLKEFDKTNLFPNEYNSIESASESIIANWLNSNINFDSFPDEISFDSSGINEKGKFEITFMFRRHSESKWLKGILVYESSTPAPFTQPKEINCDFTKREKYKKRKQLNSRISENILDHHD